MGTRTDPLTFALVLLRDAPVLEFVLFSQCLDYANRLAGHPVYNCEVIALENAISENGCGLQIQSGKSLSELNNADAIAVFGNARAPDEALGEVLFWLRYQARRGALIGSIANGADALARCGLLDGTRVALPRLSLAAFAEAFPDIETTLDLFVIAGQRFTCGGGTATVDLALQLIAMQQGVDVACYVADACVHDFSARRVQQRGTMTDKRFFAADRRLYNAVKLMRQYIEEPLSIEQIARLAGTSLRQLQRAFRRHLSITPCQYYMDLRLWHARSLLLESDLSVTEVSIASGFVSHSNFSARYRQAFERSPSEEKSNKWQWACSKSPNWGRPTVDTHGISSDAPEQGCHSRAVA